MKKIFFILVTLLIFGSCTVFYGVDYGKLTQQLELGMSKEEAIGIMGKDFFIESALQTFDGKMEVLHFRAAYYSDYLLYFLDGNLTEFHRYIPPTPVQQDVRIIKEESSK